MRFRVKTAATYPIFRNFNGKFATEDQQEVLFTNGTKFKIVSTDTDLFGTIYVKMREL